MWISARRLLLASGDRDLLEGLVRGRNTAQKVALRARIILPIQVRESTSQLGAVNRHSGFGAWDFAVCREPQRSEARALANHSGS